MSNTCPDERSSPIRAIDPALLSLPSTPVLTVSPANVPHSETCDWFPDLSELFQSQFYASLTETAHLDPHSPSTAITSFYQPSHLVALPSVTRSAAQSPRAPITNEFSQPRAHTQPPEEVCQLVSPPRPRRPPHPYPLAHFKHFQKQTSHPYARPSGNRPLPSVAPTSAPALRSPACVPQSPWTEPNTHPTASTLPPSSNTTSLPASRSQATSTTISISHQVHQIQEAVSALQTFLCQAFTPTDTDPDREAIETARHTARQHNHTLTELHDFLTPLPMHAGALLSATPPPLTGAQLRRLRHAALDALLDAYDLAFSPGMFLWEKKALYLRFVGAGRGLMHRVLD
ncbi:hypothetical protein MMC32_004004 [Xylographa parallela]|nr:hypothetical protein [Xylographa parallela]